jgi:hypothetical protein
MDKYTLLPDDTKVVEGRTLYRIKALREVCSGVPKGTLGGYIESLANLSQYGDAWVYGTALVYENAEVYGDAQVYRNAVVCGNAQVCGDAQVYGNAVVYGNAQVCGNKGSNPYTHILGPLWKVG